MVVGLGPFPSDLNGPGRSSLAERAVIVSEEEFVPVQEEQGLRAAVLGSGEVPTGIQPAGVVWVVVSLSALVLVGVWIQRRLRRRSEGPRVNKLLRAG